MSMTQANTSIQDAYANLLMEAKSIVPKFKVGTKVGIGQYSGDGQYYPHDTGTVSKITKMGDHEVTFDNQRSTNGGDEPVAHTSTFNSGGYSIRNGDPRMLLDIDQHNSNVADSQEHAVRRNDLNTVMNHINAKRNVVGNYSKLDTAQADHLKALLDKHTEA